MSPGDTALFCDTSFFFASLTSADPCHARARAVLLTLQNSRLLTTRDIVSETVTLLRYRAGYRLAADFLNRVKPGLELISTDDFVFDEAEKIFKKFSRDKKLSFCDCISFVILTTRLKDVKVLTFDADFRRFGFSLRV